MAFTTFLAPGLGNFALFRVSSLAVFSTLLCVGPIYSLPLGYLIKGERVTCRAVVGSVVAVLGVVPMFFGEQLGFVAGTSRARRAAREARSTTACHTSTSSSSQSGFFGDVSSISEDGRAIDPDEASFLVVSGAREYRSERCEASRDAR